MGKKSRKPPKQAADAPPPPPPAREVGAADDDTSLWHGARERFHAGAVVAVAEADPRAPSPAASASSASTAPAAIPFFVVDRRSHRSRWAAYVQLRASAKRGDGDAAAALAAFDELRYDAATAPKEATVEAAGAMVDGALEQLRSLLGADAFAARREAEVKTVVDVLRKFEGNQFQFEHGGPGVGAACALYRRVARANRPTGNASRATAAWPCGPAATPRRRALTIRYGAAELVGWDVAKRRAYLEKHNGFFCRCVRCELEGAS
ncbi:hypothetical protein JL720_14644 [Aureococcus anophagefferens]|nr:hypothetical protein JL720_14644 [Aureococcus anophagefferens]